MTCTFVFKSYSYCSTCINSYLHIYIIYIYITLIWNISIHWSCTTNSSQKWHKSQLIPLCMGTVMASHSQGWYRILFTYAKKHFFTLIPFPSQTLKTTSLKNIIALLEVTYWNTWKWDPSSSLVFSCMGAAVLVTYLCIQTPFLYVTYGQRGSHEQQDILVRGLIYQHIIHHYFRFKFLPVNNTYSLSSLWILTRYIEWSLRASSRWLPKWQVANSLLRLTGTSDNFLYTFGCLNERILLVKKFAWGTKCFWALQILSSYIS